VADRARAPRHSPRATSADVVSKILYLRQHYHFGPGKIAAYLETCSRGVGGLRLGASHSAAARHEPAAGQPQVPAARAPLDALREGAAGHRLQVDVKCLERIPGTRTRLYQFTAIDDCTRIRVLKIYDACNQGTAIRFLDECCDGSVPRPRVQTDNGAEFNRTATGVSSAWISATCTSDLGRRI
jgi:hypothetical protein